MSLNNAGNKVVLYDANGSALLFDAQAARVSLYAKDVAAGDAALRIAQDSNKRSLAILPEYNGVVAQVIPPIDDNGTVSCLAVIQYPQLYSGVGWDRVRGNTEVTLLTSAARVATTSSADQKNVNARGVRVRINVTAIGPAPSVTVAIEEKDSISGNYVAILTSAAITTVGQKATLVVYPGVAALANVKSADPLPRTWRVTVTHANGDSITYSVDYAYIL